MSTDAERKTILLVDDSPDNLQLLSSLLKAHYKVKAATSGAKALEVVAKGPPDLVLLDVVMPGMSGFEVCRHLKADAATQGIPVIFVTGTASPEDEQQALAAGGLGLLTKPIDPVALLARVQAALG